MAGKVLSAPPVGSEEWLLVDWLELRAFLSPFNEANLDDVVSTLALQADDAEEDIAERDRQEEECRTNLEEEISYRANGLKEAYPFSLSEDGEQLIYDEGDGDNAIHASYLVCLILSHVTRSPILTTPPKPRLVREARKRLFQIIATLAAAGHAQGGAVSLGWPRESKESIIAVVTRAVEQAQTGNARPEPHGLEPKKAKDGGLDVLAWKTAPDGPPPETFYYVQAASGHNWQGKSSKGDYEKFLHCYFDARPECNHAFMTICPFRLDNNTRTYQQIEHGIVSDRTRAPAMVKVALDMVEDGSNIIDEAQNVGMLTKWLLAYRELSRATA